MHPALLSPPVLRVNGAFTVSFAEYADGGPDTMLHLLRGFQFRIWHRWNGCVVNTAVVIERCVNGMVYGMRMQDGWEAAGMWQCAVADLVHLEYQ